MNDIASTVQASFVSLCLILWFTAVKPLHFFLRFACVAWFVAPLTAGPLKLKVDPAASSVTFDVRVNIGIDSFTGRVEAWTLDLTMPAAGDVPDRAVFTADATAVKTGKDSRDEKMWSWLEYATHPTVQYEMKTIRTTATGFEADGELTIHGKTQPLTLPITIERTDTALTVKGGVTIDTRTFDLRLIRMAGLITVKPKVKIAFVVTGTLE
jgi:polyisoprenoid-binding protein YceI